MISEPGSKISFLAIIAGRKRKDALLTALLDTGIHLINTVYCKGTVNASFLRNTFGFVPEKDKVIITCLSTGVKIDIVIKMLENRFEFNRPNTGIAFTVSVDKVSY